MKILGISCYYHDSAAVLLDDGRVIAAASEERFSRKKHDSSFPKLAIEFCLKRARIKAGDLDWVVFYEKPFLKFERITLSFLATAPRARKSFVNAYKTWFKTKLWIKSTLAEELDISTDKILFSGHHLSHAASAYYPSGFDSAALLTVDGVGEWTTTAWGVAKANKVKLTHEIKFPHSLGLFYSAITQFLGFRINNGEFKVMGLAPYGEPKYYNKLNATIQQSTDGSYKLDLSYFNYHLSDTISYSKKFIKLLGVKPQTSSKSENVVKVYTDIAASAQKVLEEKLLVIAKHIHKETGEENLCYAGGVALNGVANWRIFKEAGFNNIFVQPEAGDAGGALGASLYVYHHVLNKPIVQNYYSVFLGAENTNSEIRRYLDEKRIKYKKFSDKDLVKRVVSMIVAGKVVAWSRGRFEWGPRALGARSILADPRSKKMKDLVNAKIKFREPFRPFAPVVLLDSANRYFELTKEELKQQPLEYMLAVVQVREKYKEKLGAVTHVNGSARPQLIRRSINPLYYDVVKEFGRRTGIEVVLNTSFNLRGQPIVNTSKDAYETFMNSGIDALVLENYFVTK